MKFDTRKALLGTTAIVGASLLAAAPAVAKPVVNIGGAMDFQVGWTSQDREGWSPTPGGTIGPSTERGYSAFQKTNILINASDVTDLGMKWAFRVKLNADADGGPGAPNGLKNGKARDASDAVTLALSDFWGQVTVGADHPVYDRMTYGSGDAVGAAGTGGVDGNWARWYNRKSFSGARFESSTTVRDATTSSRITYVTPRIVGFQAGVAYAMDRTTIGRFREPEAFGTASTAANSVEQNFWAAAVNYVNKFGDFDVGLSFAGTEASNSNELLQNTRSFHTGAVVGYGPWKIGGRYAWKPDSVDNASTSTNNDYDQWDLGVGFTTGPWSLALSFMRQEQGMTNATGSASNDVYAFGTTYDMGGGLQLYGEVFHAKTENSSSTANAASNNEGTGLITGVRVKF